MRNILPHEVPVQMLNGRYYMQSVGMNYEWVAYYCTRCKCLGQQRKQCKREREICPIWVCKRKASDQPTKIVQP